MKTHNSFPLPGPVQRIVVKVGSGVLTRKNSLNTDIIACLADQICQLYERGIKVILVSSGAMAAGVTKLGLAGAAHYQ